MYRVSVEADFSAAHFLQGYRGKCENVHGHNYKVEAHLEAEGLDKVGIAVDFSIVKKGLREILAELDHKSLNELDYFKGINPSAENIARFIFNKLNERLKGEPAKLAAVTIGETDTSRVTYQP